LWREDRLHRIGILDSGSEAAVARNLESFRNGMRHSYVERRNVIYD